MANNTNELAGIFSGIGSALSNLSTESADKTYAETLRINQSIKILKDSRNYQKELKQDAINERNDKQNIINQTNVNDTNFINDTIKLLANRLSLPNQSEEEIIGVVDLIKETVNAREFGDGLRKQVAMSSIDILESDSLEGEKRLGGIVDLDAEFTKYKNKRVLSGDFSNTNNESEAIRLNAQSLNANSIKNKNKETRLDVKSITDTLSKMDFITNTFAKYDVSKFNIDDKEGTAHLQLGTSEEQKAKFKRVLGEAEIESLNNANQQFKDGNLDTAYNILTNMGASRISDRNNAYKIHKAIDNKNQDDFIASTASSQDIISAIGPDIGLDTAGLTSHFQTLKFREGETPSQQSTRSWDALNKDVGRITFMLSQDSDFKSMSKIKNEHKTLNEQGLAYLAAGLISKAKEKKDGLYNWNVALGENVLTSFPYKGLNNKGEIAILHDYFDLGGTKWDENRVESSIQELVEMYKGEKPERFNSEDVIDMSSKEKRQFFYKMNKLVSLKMNHPLDDQYRMRAQKDKAYGSNDMAVLKEKFKASSIYDGFKKEHKGEMSLENVKAYSLKFGLTDAQSRSLKMQLINPS